MKSQTSQVARSCRIREWAAMVQECRNRPNGMSVEHEIIAVPMELMHLFPFSSRINYAICPKTVSKESIIFKHSS